MSAQNQQKERSESLAIRIKRALHDLHLKSDNQKFELCRLLLQEKNGSRATDALANILSGLQRDHRRYWISCIYTLLMSDKKRKKLAAYFTPPHLTHFVLGQLEKKGVDLLQARFLDPACGGAAFLAPIAERVRHLGLDAGWTSEDIVRHIERKFLGLEIEPQLAKIAQLIVQDALAEELRAVGRPLAPIVSTTDTLKENSPENSKLFDVVVANPPYGRVLRPSKQLLRRWPNVVTDGHVNTYALFVGVALEWVKPGGIAALIIPTSFIGGPYFSRLRKYILNNADVLSIDVIEKRSDVFLDVVQDTCVIFMKRHVVSKHQKISPVCSVIHSNGEMTKVGFVNLPSLPSDRIWVLPESTTQEAEEQIFFHPTLVNLESYGYRARVGHFVWNRNQHRIRAKHEAEPGDVPLLWASDVKRGQAIDLGRLLKERTYVSMPRKSPALLKNDIILLQRTTNRKQAYRLNGCVIGGTTTKKGFVTENHTIVIEPWLGKKQCVSLDVLCKLLNSLPVDSRFRRMSGTVSVSVKALRDLPLPRPDHLLYSLAQTDDTDAAVHAAYELTTAEESKARTAI